MDCLTFNKIVDSYTPLILIRMGIQLHTKPQESTPRRPWCSLGCFGFNSVKWEAVEMWCVEPCYRFLVLFSPEHSYFLRDWTITEISKLKLCILISNEDEQLVATIRNTPQQN